METARYKVLISGIELTIVNAAEALRMAGPFIGDVYVGETLISKNCIVENFLLQPNSNNIFYVKYHTINQFGYFSINFFNLEIKTAFEFYKEFQMLYLKEFSSENEIHIYESFNDSAGNNYYFKLDEEEFYRLKVINPKSNIRIPK
ncbi:MAG TPA: hypothetical protein VJ844_02920 [Mucilaginibacter sp.]|nr:hypothetical protein [Mucilaginibacter sp.]